MSKTVCFITRNFGKYDPDSLKGYESIGGFRALRKALTMEGYAIARQNGWMSTNDIRELENLNPVSEEEGGNAYLVNGNITNSVNLPNVSQDWSGIARVCIIHKNVPAMLTKIMATLSDDNINVENMTNKSKKDYAYTMVDVNTRISDQVADELRAIEGVIRVRVLNH